MSVGSSLFIKATSYNVSNHEFTHECRIKYPVYTPMKAKVVNQVKLYETASMMAEEIIWFLLLYSIATVQSIVVIVSYVDLERIRSAWIKHHFDLYYYRPQRKGKPIVTIPS